MSFYFSALSPFVGRLVDLPFFPVVRTLLGDNPALYCLGSLSGGQRLSKSWESPSLSHSVCEACFHIFHCADICTSVGEVLASQSSLS